MGGIVSQRIRPVNLHTPETSRLAQLPLVDHRNEEMGVPLGSEAFSGNRTDITTAEEIIEAMEARIGIAQWI